ncbi:helix-hairpin-helix domain-containing protein [Myceligenerans xiligouense]|uniref:Putative flap endonuclease-1-like 5' DNA nuclease n=1 Tax=Myceligenerans xiligouense TaxID=253184 RepID=A0A3N4YIK9_9MICO|nr:helix-hairpin-helix domain-containing protein [Myceligenerans xiligouense]RPF20603.1 putative flap endonuclease-1-like 5' DNA nuclease [Myceligenerans xiligouense]
MGWFITQSLLFIVITAIIFFLIGLWAGWILWARRNKTTGKHTAETVEKKPAASTTTTGRAAKAGALASAPDAGGSATASDADTPAEAPAEVKTDDADAPARVATPLTAPAGDVQTDDAPESTDASTDPDTRSSTGTAAEPSDIEDENLAVFAGAEAEVVAEAEAATRDAAVDEPPSETTAGAGTGPDDDLTRIEGIGPKIAAALRAAGYGSYAKVAEASEEDLRKALADSGIKFAPAAMSFAAQAQYLTEGDEEGLEEYQDYLIAGRERRSADFVEDVDYTDVDEVEGEAARQAALAADAEKVAEATGEHVDTAAVADDALATADDAGTAAAAPEPEQPADDDLKVIEGIGPKIEKALKAAGVTSYAQVAAASEDELRASIGKSGITFAPSVTSWAQQAQYLVDGDGAGLDEYQDYLIAGQERGTTVFVEEVDYTDVDEVEGAAAKQAALAADAEKVAEAEGRKA